MSGCGKSVKRNVDLFFSCGGIKSVRGEVSRVVQTCLSIQQCCLSCLSNSCQETTSSHHFLVCAFYGSKFGIISGELNSHNLSSDKYSVRDSMEKKVSERI